MKFAVVPSNQPRNAYVGMPGVSEQSDMLATGQAAVAEFQRQGHQSQLFFIAGEGSSNVDELVRMVDMAMAWKPDFIVSLHSDVESIVGRRDIFPQVRDESCRAQGELIGRELAFRLGFDNQPAAVRTDLAFFHHTVGRRAVLLEIGNHNQAANASFNWQYREFIGIQAARAVTKMIAGRVVDSPLTCAVPPGLGESAVVAAAVVPKVIKPLNPCTTFKSGMTGPLVKAYQTKLIAHGFSCGKAGADGKFFGDTERATRNFQTWVDNEIDQGRMKREDKVGNFAVDGEAGPLTQGALAVV